MTAVTPEAKSPKNSKLHQGRGQHREWSTTLMLKEQGPAVEKLCVQLGRDVEHEEKKRGTSPDESVEPAVYVPVRNKIDWGLWPAVRPVRF